MFCVFIFKLKNKQNRQVTCNKEPFNIWNISDHISDYLISEKWHSSFFFQQCWLCVQCYVRSTVCFVYVGVVCCWKQAVATTQVSHMIPAYVGRTMLITVDKRVWNDSLSHGQSKQHYTHISTIHSGDAWTRVHLCMTGLFVCLCGSELGRERRGWYTESGFIFIVETFSDIWWVCNLMWL